MLRPWRTVRQRFTVLYAGLFLISGAGLLVLTNLLARTQVTQPAAAPGGAADQVRLLQAQLAEVHAIQARQLLAGSLIALLVMAAVAVLLGDVAARRVLRPLRTITAATRRITADNLHERLAVAGPADEVKALADTVDGLLGRLEAAFAAQRRFVANASHELRTPLATIRAALDVAMAKPEPVPPQTRALADRVRTELDHVDRLLEDLLVLARAQHGVLAGEGPVPLGALVSDAVSRHRAAAAAGQLTLEIAPDTRASVRGRRTLLARLVDNLVDNAVRHNDDGGWIRIRTGTADAAAYLVVENGGGRIDPAHLTRLAEPFGRLADRTAAGPGLGLGLSIVAAVAEAHGGRLDLHARPDGGLRVTVWFPDVPA
ncbi:sensor histidine kinase [Jidongwangia harbinensis]|uniref:sensor histidine kinase n=1 Tax=Jidongwangia harbinensis TaxID=2878561 RepID=UPI001CD99FC0|nr:HAMP domain-containing sensor histidine kinase [Jidongwangia harbinensis]MCA2211934.1 HAMP domain-containing histidine kinase [Jidongwangia harbinensis]